MHEKSIKLLETSDHYLDKWPWAGNFPEPLDERNVRAFQRQIDRICGLAVNGKPNVRLIWPGSRDESISMHYVEGEKRARYCIYSEEYECQATTPGGLIKVEIVTVDITPPRWMLEEYSEPNDQYLHLKTLGYHDDRCCNGSESVRGHLCFGLYREPERCDLDDLQRMVKLREEMPGIVKADQPLTYHEVQAGLQRIRAMREHAEQKVKEQYKEAIISGLVPQIPRLFSDDPGVQKWGKYHWVGDGIGHSKSGLPQNKKAEEPKQCENNS